MDLYRLNSSTFTSDPITHSRLKSLSRLSQSTEDHISRIGLALSLRRGALEGGWTPTKGDGEIEQSGFFPGSTRRERPCSRTNRDVVSDDSTSPEPERLRRLEGRCCLHWERGCRAYEIATLKGTD